MIIDWVHFVFALLLLWLPRSFLRLGRISRSRKRRRADKPAFDPDPRSIREPGDSSVRFQSEFAKLRNYVDLLRAALGGVLLMGIMPVIEPAVQAAIDAPATTGQEIFYGRLLVLVVAVMIQSLRLESRATMFAPIFFLSGLSIGLCGPYPAIFALVLIWTINLAMPNPTAFLSVYAAVILVFGTLFLGVRSMLPLFTAALSFLPVLVSLLIRRPLVLFARKARSGSTLAIP